MIVKKIEAKKILNSKNQPAIEITVNNFFKGSAPLGTSKGKHEVSDYGRKGLVNAIKTIKNNRHLINNKFDSFEDLRYVEEKLHGLGGNTIIALESALLKAMSQNEVWRFLDPRAYSIPKPLGNVIGGGLHVKGSSPDFQEFLLMPMADEFYKNKRAMELIYNTIGKKLNYPKKTAESAYSPNLSNIEVIKLIKKTIEELEYNFEFPVHLGLDVASTSFYKNKFYNYKNFSKENKIQKLNKQSQIIHMNTLIQEFDLRYVEDPLYEEDFEGFSKIKGPLICGDDLICTDLKRLKKAKINTVIVKPNQIGSLIKTKELVDYCKKNNITPVISHRSGETNDVLITHLAVAWEIPFIKTGIMGEERRAKLRELVRIEKEI
ncbi:MAG: hypothetical protein PHE43_02325 [Candidatus Nanoarchaeia archaeon]|nr:hypothetical protein [Candidatus Nanoarchaeia archaeon]